MIALIVLALFALILVSAAVVSHLKKGGKHVSLRHMFAGMALTAWAKRVFSDDGELKQVTSLAESNTWSGLDDLQLQPHQADGTGNIALGWFVDAKGKIDRSRVVYSDGDTPVGIVAGGTGSRKTSSVLAEAVLRHGRRLDGRVLQWLSQEGAMVKEGAPLALFAPKPELAQIMLKGRLAQGEVAIWVPDGPSLKVLPPELKPYLAPWTPLSQCTNWDGAQAMGEALTAGSTGSGSGNGAFWEGSAERLVAAAMLCVVQRGPGGTLLDVYDALTAPKKIMVDDGDGGKKEVTLSALAALHGELAQRLATMKLVPEAERTPALQERIADTELALRAIADLAVSEAGATNSSIVTTAATALKSTLRAGTTAIAWDDPNCINIEKLLVDSSGTIAVVATPTGMRACRPLTSAFINAIKRHLELRAFQCEKGRLERQVLVLIDELPVVMGAGEIFGEWCATARSQAVQLLWASQDVSSLDQWGTHLRNKTINNTSDRLWYPSIADEVSLKLGEMLAGEHKTWSKSISTARSTGQSSGESSSSNSGKSSTDSVAETWRPMMPAGRLSRLKPGESVLVGPGRVCQLAVRWWEADPVLKSIKETGQPPAAGFTQPGDLTDFGQPCGTMDFIDGALPPVDAPAWAQRLRP
jgi:hypothetical protein